MSKCKSKTRLNVANDARKRERERKKEKEKERESDGGKFNERHLCCYNRGKISNTHTQHKGFTKRKDTKKYTRKQSER
jgi:hypothetical protein